MAVYISVILMTTGLAYLYSKAKGNITKNILFFVLVLVPALVCGLRGVGTDYLGMVNNFDKILGGNYYLVDYSSLWIQFLLLTGKMGINAQVPICICSFITISIIFYIFKVYEKNIDITFAVFSFMTSFYLLSFNLYRQLLANAIFLLGIVIYETKGNKQIYWILGAISVWIHSSCLPFLPIIFWWKFVVNISERRKRLLFYVIGTICVFSIPVISNRIARLITFLPHYAYYLEKFEFQGLGFGIVRYLVLAVCPALIYQKKRDNQKLIKANLGFLNFFAIFGTILWLTSYVSETYIYRVSYGFLIALPLLHGVIAKDVVGRYRLTFKKRGFIFMLASISVILVFCYYDFVVINSGVIVPYKFFWG